MEKPNVDLVDSNRMALIAAKFFSCGRLIFLFDELVVLLERKRSLDK